LTALHLAASYGHTTTVSVLLKSGANINAATSAKATALHEAALLGHGAVVDLLLEHGADPVRFDLMS
jgi:ankyrin repeat protein